MLATAAVGTSVTAAAGDTYARNGSPVLPCDSRGFGESGGEVGVAGPTEVNDAQDLITWLANLERDGEAWFTVPDSTDENALVGANTTD